MKIQYLGHAGFLIECKNIQLLMDPWFYPAFLKSWFPYPNNRHLLDTLSGRTIDFLYVSHLHEDHFDRKVLASLDKSIQILCPNYRSKGVARAFRSLGFKEIIPLDHQQQYVLAPETTVTMYMDISHKEDSGLLVEAEGFRFLDLNDCNTQLAELPTGVDLLAAQYSGAQWYPQCYSYPADLMAQKVQQVRKDLMDTLVRKCKVTGAKAYLPSAGPACFLDPELQHYQHNGIFPTWEEVSADFSRDLPAVQVMRMHPGDLLSCKSEITLETASPTYPELTIQEYSDLRRDEWDGFAGHSAEITTAELSAYFGKLQKRNPRLMAHMTKYFKVATEDSQWGVHLGSLIDDFVIETEDPVDPEYVLSVPSLVLRAVLQGEVGWEEALLSMRVRLHRDPDVFDSRFMGLLRYGHEPLQTQQMALEAACSEICTHESGLRFQRYCPHAGEDLLHAIVKDGVIECPRHHWKWDAVTGKCIEGGSIAIKVETIHNAAAGVPV